MTLQRGRPADPAVRRLAGDERADPFASPRVRELLRFPGDHPYRKWWGTHWRLVELADLRIPPEDARVEPGIDQVLRWLASPRRRFRMVGGLIRRCASQEGNAVYAASILGFARDPRVGRLVEWLMDWQWPDGGWNCDQKASGRRSSFHETVTPAIGLAAYHAVSGDTAALHSARRAAELILEHSLFRSLRTGEVIHPSWIELHYPPYWHYDILQGLALLRALDMLRDPRAAEALALLGQAGGRDGRFAGRSWTSPRLRPAVPWGRGRANEMLNLRAEQILEASTRG